jgi:hypothetical protein
VAWVIAGLSALAALVAWAFPAIAASDVED